MRTSETIGMSQRGGSVVSHVRMGEEVHSPMIPEGQADLILAFEPAEAVRSLSYLKKGGAVVVNRKAVQSAVSTLSQQGYEGDEMIEYLRATGSPALCGGRRRTVRQGRLSQGAQCGPAGTAAASGALGITPEEMEREIRRRCEAGLCGDECKSPGSWSPGRRGREDQPMKMTELQFRADQGKSESS